MLSERTVEVFKLKVSERNEDTAWLSGDISRPNALFLSHEVFKTTADVLLLVVLHCENQVLVSLKRQLLLTN